MADTAVKLASDGSVNQDATTTAILMGSDEGCCCGPEYDCCLCNECCFSSLSTIDYSLGEFTVDSSSGDTSDFPSSVSVSDAPFREPCGQIPDFIAQWWDEVPSGTGGGQQFVHGAAKRCVGGAWLGGGYIPTTDEFGFDVKQIHITTNGGALDPGDCCGIDTTILYYIQKTERTRYEDEENPGTFLYTEWEETGFQDGTAHFVVTVSNNACCKEAPGCHKVEGNCDGECPDI